MALLNANEIENALKSMPNGKAPGIDGLTVAFYKAYKSKLIPPSDHFV